MGNLWDDYAKEIASEPIAFAFDKNGCLPFTLSNNPIKEFVERSFSHQVRFYDATMFLMTSCTNDGFWKMLQMIDTNVILIAYDITVENVEKAKKTFGLNNAFKTVVGYPIYGNVVLIAQKYLPQDLLKRVQKIEEKADPAF